MKEEPAKFITPEWPGWKLINATESTSNKITYKLVVDEKVINDVMEYGGMVAKAKEPFMESIMNMFVRFISGMVPGADLKCAYVLDFGDAGKVNLFMANDVWSSHALISTNHPEKLDLLVDATKEYIRYRCFVDSIQPQQ
ncbi:MAG: hypothetical protein ACSHX6_02805 [Akkermansiaceae bacterium]